MPEDTEGKILHECSHQANHILSPFIFMVTLVRSNLTYSRLDTSSYNLFLWPKSPPWKTSHNSTKITSILIMYRHWRNVGLLGLTLRTMGLLARKWETLQGPLHITVKRRPSRMDRQVAPTNPSLRLYMSSEISFPLLKVDFSLLYVYYG